MSVEDLHRFDVSRGSEEVGVHSLGCLRKGRLGCLKVWMGLEVLGGVWDVWRGGKGRSLGGRGVEGLGVRGGLVFGMFKGCGVWGFGGLGVWRSWGIWGVGGLGCLGSAVFGG